MPDVQRPRVFIGSSSESLPLVTVLKKELESYAEVRPWTDSNIFQATNFIAEDLLRSPHYFDFGLFLFEPDDTVQSRGVSSLVPRDNVVFELGLFMSRLGLKRALALAPRGRVKILSDLAGLKIFTYVIPNQLDELRRYAADATDPLIKKTFSDAIENLLKSALKETCDEIKSHIETHGCADKGLAPEVSNVTNASPALRRALQQALDLRTFRSPTGKLRVRHLALDMSEAWGVLVEEVLHPAKDNPIEWQCLMIDPDSPNIKAMASPSVSIDIASARIRQIKEFMKNRALGERTFECRTYSHPPMMHGFLVNGSALLWAFCDLVDGKLEGSNTPYWRFDKADEQAPVSHPIRSFAHWFDYWWEQSKSKIVWPE